MPRFLISMLVALALGGCATVPVSAPTAVQTGAAGIFHTVQPKQTLWRICKTYGADMRSVMLANNIVDASRISTGQQLFIPGAPAPLRVPERVAPPDIGNILSVSSREVKWRSITIHHSATATGCASSFDRSHRKRGMGGLFYHFVIGNGTSSGDGQIEAGWRWNRQAQVNRPNDINICLVGNFNRQAVSEKQYASLMALVRGLEKRYSIQTQRIRRHKDVAKKATDCPGKNFPWARLKRDLGS